MFYHIMSVLSVFQEQNKYFRFETTGGGKNIIYCAGSLSDIGEAGAHKHQSWFPPN